MPEVWPIGMVEVSQAADPESTEEPYHPQKAYVCGGFEVNLYGNVNWGDIVQRLKLGKFRIEKDGWGQGTAFQTITHAGTRCSITTVYNYCMMGGIMKDPTNIAECTDKV